MTRAAMTKFRKVKTASGRVYMVAEPKGSAWDRLLYGASLVLIPFGGVLILAKVAGMI